MGAREFALQCPFEIERSISTRRRQTPGPPAQLFGWRHAETCGWPRHHKPGLPRKCQACGCQHRHENPFHVHRASAGDDMRTVPSINPVSPASAMRFTARPLELAFPGAITRKSDDWFPTVCIATARRTAILRAGGRRNTRCPPAGWRTLVAKQSHQCRRRHHGEKIFGRLTRTTSGVLCSKAINPLSLTLF